MGTQEPRGFSSSWRENNMLRAPGVEQEHVVLHQVSLGFVVWLTGILP